MEKDLIRQAFEEFKLYTLKAIDSIENENYEDIDNLISKRQEILDSIEKMQCSKEECANIASELDILTSDKLLSDLIIKKRREVKEEIDVIGRSRVATNSYINKLKGAAIFSKKI